MTFPLDINNRGQIVGFTLDGALDEVSLATLRSFLLARGANGRFTRINFPGATTTLASGLNDRGQMTGAYNNPSAARSRRTPGAGSRPSTGPRDR